MTCRSILSFRYPTVIKTISILCLLNINIIHKWFSQGFKVTGTGPAILLFNSIVTGIPFSYDPLQNYKFVSFLHNVAKLTTRQLLVLAEHLGVDEELELTTFQYSS